jgi:uncharacterized coiled-coil protein SlyX
MTYEYKYMTNEEKINAIEVRQKINESDIYDFELHLAELNLAVVKDQEVIEEFTNRIQDKIAQNAMLESLINELS